MKKLIFTLLFFNTLFSQQANTPSPLYRCAAPETYVTFDLTVAIPEILGSQDPLLFGVAFYSNEYDAAASINELPTSLTIVAGTAQTLVTKVTELSSGQSATTTLDVYVEAGADLQDIGPIVISEYPFDGFAAFDFTTINSSIDTDNYTFAYYLTESDAQLQVNSIPNQSSFTNTQNPQQMWIGATSLSGCYVYAPFMIQVYDDSVIVNIPDPNFKAALVQYNAINPSYALDLNGDGEIQVGEAAAYHELDLGGWNISDITGIEAFTNLEQLAVSDNDLIALDVSMLPNLWLLYANDNPLTSVSLAPKTKIFAADNTALASLDLTDLPFLQSVVMYGSSQLISFKASNLPNFSGLDVPNSPLLQNIEITDCPLFGYLNIENTPVIEHMDFHNSYSDPELINASLELTLDNSHFLQDLNLSGCAALYKVQVTNTTGPNVLNTIDISGCNNLDTLLLQGCNFPALTIPSLPELHNLTLAQNTLLNLTIESSPVYYFTFNQNNTTQLDLSHLPGISSIYLNDNLNLTNLNIKNGHHDNLIASNNPGLIGVCADESEITEIQAVVGPSVSVNSYCSMAPGGNYNTITGTVKFDQANDGCENDPSFAYKKVDLFDGTTTYSTFTDASGTYVFYVLAGNFTVTPEFETTGFTVSPASASVNFADDNNNTSINDFCISANGVNPDLEVIVSPTGAPIPGFNTTYQVTLRNKGNQIQSQLYGLTCSYDYYQMDYISTSPASDAYASGTIYWSYENLMPFETRTFFCTVKVHAPTDLNPVNSGDAIQVSAGVPTFGDSLPDDNNFVLNQTAVNSLDPNDILCLEGDSQPTSEIGEYLHYRIRFENTGTAPAQNVVVRLPLNPAQYQTDSVQLLFASHPVKGNVKNNVAEFMFENLNLDSGGHGNVLLKVRSLNTLQQGDSAINGAGIYFDYNFPVQTNNAETVFADLSSGSPVKDASVQIYPNPVQNQVTVKAGSTLEKIELYDVQGRLLQISPASGNESILEMTQYASGNYFVKVVSRKGASVQKIVKK
ncbi:DUF7619 domain-containing protein [Flavobacterium silvaticum]|uniref:T9SS type A sorting domain-containing protein n=1 Tax=Flavobacterium silvaticum TaxID=1852020 RepID=A0A972FPM9_9FLAO|nr:T9SS type A sorting domain-containing protein [Flavobacterium silvaticum]NMH29553.1 T9SS type A sorting domain-containing protein [Flavobacterium silvaticum]